MRQANRRAPREDQVGFRFLVSIVWLAVVVYMLVVMALVG